MTKEYFYKHEKSNGARITNKSRWRNATGEEQALVVENWTAFQLIWVHNPQDTLVA